MRCKIVRTEISSAQGAEQALPEALTHHLSECTACSQFARACEDLDVALRPVQTPQAPEHLHTRIMASVREVAAPGPVAGIATRRLALLAGAGILCAAIILATRLRPDVQGDASASLQSEPSAVSIGNVDDYRRIVAQVANEATIAATQVMEAEMDDLRSDLQDVSQYFLTYLN